jgi:hypothetical protein
MPVGATGRSPLRLDTICMQICWNVMFRNPDAMPLRFEPRIRWMSFNSQREENLLDIYLAGDLCNTDDRKAIQEEL